MPAGPFVDRIEGEVAVLLLEGKEERVPLAQLPQGVREGVFLTPDRRAIDEQASPRVSEQVRQRRKRLQDQGGGGGDFSL